MTAYQRALAAAALSFAPFMAWAGCKELAAAVEQSQKEIADEFNRDGGKYSPALSAFSSARLQAIAINLTLMERAKCTLPTDPVSPDGEAYWKAASGCLVARGDAIEACKKENWKRWQ